MPARNEAFLLTYQELDTAYGAGPLAFSIYVLLRSWMDEAMGVVGVSRPISMHMLAMYCETHTPKGKGEMVEKPSYEQIRTALARLKRAGLVVPWKGPSFAFGLPLSVVERE